LIPTSKTHEETLLVELRGDLLTITALGADGSLGSRIYAQRAIARYFFSYYSREPESAGTLIVVEGMARFQLRDDLIAHYCEAGDRGMTFVQLGYVEARIGKLLHRFANVLKESSLAKQHLERRASQC
jgi:hypothetical protein